MENDSCITYFPMESIFRDIFYCCAFLTILLFCECWWIAIADDQQKNSAPIKAVHAYSSSERLIEPFHHRSLNTWKVSEKNNTNFLEVIASLATTQGGKLHICVILGNYMWNHFIRGKHTLFAQADSPQEYQAQNKIPDKIDCHTETFALHIAKRAKKKIMKQFKAQRKILKKPSCNNSSGWYLS